VVRDEDIQVVPVENKKSRETTHHVPFRQCVEEKGRGND
jgi:hypothetical protein